MSTQHPMDIKVADALKALREQLRVEIAKQPSSPQSDRSIEVVFKLTELAVKVTARSPSDSYSSTSASHNHYGPHSLLDMTDFTQGTVTYAAPRRYVMELQPKAKPNRAAVRAEAIFDFIALLIPKRLRNEELGDASEVIEARIRAGHPSWKIYTKVASTIFWIAVNSCRELAGAVLGRAKSGN